MNNKIHKTEFSGYSCVHWVPNDITLRNTSIFSFETSIEFYVQHNNDMNNDI